MLISLCTPVLHNEFYNEVPVYIGFFSHSVSESRGTGLDSSSRQAASRGLSALVWRSTAVWHLTNISTTSVKHQLTTKSLHHIRKFIEEHDATLVATAVVSARIDYCNSLLYGTSKSCIDKQQLQNLIACVVVCTGNSIASLLSWLLCTASISVLV